MRKEIPYLHYVRAIACLMVVMLHCLPRIEGSAINYYLYILVKLFTRPCVPLFFMVSGVLLLPYKADNLFGYYKKRLSRIAFPLLFWGIIYAVLPYLIGIEDISEMIFHLCLVPLTYPPQIGGILWFMYIIMGIYLIIPFINPKIFDNKKSVLMYIAIWIVSIIVMLVQCYFPNVLGMTPFCDINMLVYFSGYLGYLFLGKYLDVHYSIRSRNVARFSVLPILYLMCMCIIFILSDAQNRQIMGSFLTIPAVIMSGIVFLFLKELIRDDNAIGYKQIKKISKLSYGIYLSHMLIYTLLTNQLQYNEKGYLVIEYIVLMSLTFICSYLFCLLLSKLPFSKYIIGI